MSSLLTFCQLLLLLLPLLLVWAVCVACLPAGACTHLSCIC
jgi:hypothetical protein